MRERLEASRGERDLKRGFGGLVDVEFLVQLFQLKYGRSQPALRVPNTSLPSGSRWRRIPRSSTAARSSRRSNSTSSS